MNSDVRVSVSDCVIGVNEVDMGNRKRVDRPWIRAAARVAKKARKISRSSFLPDGIVLLQSKSLRAGLPFAKARDLTSNPSMGGLDIPPAQKSG